MALHAALLTSLPHEIAVMHVWQVLEANAV